MLRTLTITTAATDLQLLTIAEMRAAAGVSDNSQDAQLTAMGLKIAADIATECNIAVGSGAPPTLRRETLTEVVRGAYADLLVLARRHEIVITSVVEDGTTVDAADYLVNPESGEIHRLCSDLVTTWCADKVTVVYAAGFDTVPYDLKDAATDFFRSAWQAQDRDPLVRGLREDVPGVGEKETTYWVGSVPGQSNEGAVPDAIDGKLKRFRNTGVA
jgi:hypothetical protein